MSLCSMSRINKINCVTKKGVKWMLIKGHATALSRFNKYKKKILNPRWCRRQRHGGKQDADLVSIVRVRPVWRVRGDLQSCFYSGPLRHTGLQNTFPRVGELFFCYYKLVRGRRSRSANHWYGGLWLLRDLENVLHLTRFYILLFAYSPTVLNVVVYIENTSLSSSKIVSRNRFFVYILAYALRELLLLTAVLNTILVTKTGFNLFPRDCSCFFILSSVSLPSGRSHGVCGWIDFMVEMVSFMGYFVRVFDFVFFMID